jgi:hypothetical protein
MKSEVNNNLQHVSCQCCQNVARIGMAQDRDKWRALVNSVLNLRVP